MNTTDQPILTTEQQQFFRQVRNPWKMGVYYLQHLPSLFWWGIRVVGIDQTQARVRIPFSWRTQNPFRSVYFAAQTGAAELSTGLLVLAATQGKGRFSMLVIGSTSEFSKKADGPITFQCKDGLAIWEAVERAAATGESQVFEATTVGTLPDGQEVARMRFKWSVLAKK